MAKKIVLVFFIATYCCMLLFFLPTVLKSQSGIIIDQKYTNAFTLKDGNATSRCYTIKYDRLLINTLIISSPFAIAYILLGKKKIT